MRFDTFPAFSKKQMKFVVSPRWFLDATLKGVSQIMLQENRWTGVLFLIGLCTGNWIFGLAALVASAVGAGTALVARFPEKEIDSGLYGFSAALVGVALVFLFKTTFLLWVLLVVGSVAAALLQGFFLRRKIPVYTLPFILITWALVFVIRETGLLPPSVFSQTIFSPSAYPYLFAATNGFGEVIFQDGVWAGCLFFLGVLISNPVAAGYALLASAIGAGVAFGTGAEAGDIQMGLFGFNAVLTAIVFAGPTWKAALWTLLGVATTLFLHLIFVKMDWFALIGGPFTFPFVLGTWITLFFRKKRRF